MGVYKTLDLKIKPSEMLGITNTYEAYCFDECCAFIIKELKDGKKIKAQQKMEKGYARNYSKPSDLYKQFE